MDDLKINGYRIHLSIKIPHLYEKTPLFSYQFLIYDKKGKLMNYPFSRIIAKDDKEFSLKLKRNFKDHLNNEIRTYPVSKFLEKISENSQILS